MIESSRLKIRPLQIKDAKIYSGLRNEDFVRKYNVMEVISKEDAEEIIGKLKVDEGGLLRLWPICIYWHNF